MRGRIQKIIDFAKVRGYRSGENQAVWQGNLSLTLPAKNKIMKVKHQPALPYTEMADFWKQLSKQSGTAAKALSLTILTAARTTEILEATWAEVDLKAAIWTIPGERMKMGKEHRVPLAPQAVTILKELHKQRTGDFIFPSTKKPSQPLSNAAMLAVLKRMNRRDITVHGFRSTFRDWAAEKSNAPREIAEAALAHTVGNKVEAAYMRSDLFEKRKGLMVGWSGYCAESL